MNRESIDRPEDRTSTIEHKFPVWKLVGIFVLANFLYDMLHYLIKSRFSISINYFLEYLMYYSIDLLILAITSLIAYSIAKFYKRISLPNIFMRCFIFTLVYIVITNVLGTFMKLINPYIIFDSYESTIGFLPTALKTSILFVLIWLTLEHKTTKQ